MLSEKEVQALYCYWKEQLTACEVEALKGSLRVVVTLLEEILEIKDGA